LTGGYWDDFLVLPLAAAHGVPSSVAVLGDAAGTVARAYGHFFPRTRVDAVELDGELTTIGRRFFDLRGPRLRLFTADARPWLAARHARYDAIFLDAYRQPYIPFYLVTREFFASVREHLRPGGTLIVNVGHIPGSNALERVVSATAGAVFTNVLRDAVSRTNSLVVASDGPLSSGQLASEAPRALGPLADRAPVEWLTDFSILKYAF
jgi:spermidine synthase